MSPATITSRARKTGFDYPLRQGPLPPDKGGPVLDVSRVRAPTWARFRGRRVQQHHFGLLIVRDLRVTVDRGSFSAVVDSPQTWSPDPKVHPQVDLVSLAQLRNDVGRLRPARALLQGPRTIEPKKCSPPSAMRSMTQARTSSRRMETWQEVACRCFLPWPYIGRARRHRP
jgi:hypothetical protein